MLEAILGILSTAVSWIGSSNANDKTQKTLEKLKSQNVIAPAIQQGWNTLQSENALPGEETMRARNETMLPTTLNQIKDSVTSGDMMKLVTSLYTKQMEGEQNIDVMKLEGQKKLDAEKVAYLSGPMAGAQEGQLSNLMNIEMSQAMAKQDSSNQSNQYLTNLLKGVGKVGDTDWTDLIAGLSKKQGGAKSTPNIFGGKPGEIQDRIWNPETGGFEAPDINLT